MLAPAEEYRRHAAHWRKLIERAEAPGGSYGKLADWPATKTKILEYIRQCERDAEEAEARVPAAATPWR